MKKVDQAASRYGSGCCFQACIASILELELDAVPPFNDKHWLFDFKTWLNVRGKDIIQIMGVPKQHPLSTGLWIANGHTSRGTLHACVYRGARLAHDPNPEGEGLAKVLDMTIIVDK